MHCILKITLLLNVYLLYNSLEKTLQDIEKFVKKFNNSIDIQMNTRTKIINLKCVLNIECPLWDCWLFFTFEFWRSYASVATTATLLQLKSLNSFNRAILIELGLVVVAKKNGYLSWSSNNESEAE